MLQLRRKDCITEFARDSNAGLVGVAYLARVALTEHNAKVRDLVEKNIASEKEKIAKASTTFNNFLLTLIPVVALGYVGFLTLRRRR